MNIKQSVKNWFRFLRRRPRRGGSDFIAPRRDWLWTLGLAFSILVLGAAGLVYHFFTVQNAVLEEVAVETTLIRYRQAEVSHFLTEMEARTEAHTILRATRHAAPAPVSRSPTTTPVLPATATTSPPVEESGAM